MFVDSDDKQRGLSGDGGGGKVRKPVNEGSDGSVSFSSKGLGHTLRAKRR